MEERGQRLDEKKIFHNKIKEIIKKVVIKVKTLNNNLEQKFKDISLKINKQHRSQDEYHVNTDMKGQQH